MRSGITDVKDHTDVHRLAAEAHFYGLELDQVLGTRDDTSCHAKDHAPALLMMLRPTLSPPPPTH